MEQQKILWIILSVAVLLLAVLGTALFVFSPSAKTDQATVVTDTTLHTNNFDPIEWARTGSEYPSFNDLETPDTALNSDFVVIPDDADADSNEAGISVAGSEEKETTVEISLPVKKVEPPAPVKAASKAPAATKPAAPASVKPKEPVKPVKKTVTEYWIQAGSFTTTARAEEARRVLSEKGFPATIQTRDIDGTTYYRVRVGAYTTKDEADKFLTWVKDLSGFDKSYISQVTAQR